MMETQNLELIKCVQRIKKRNLNTRKQSNKATFYLLKALIWAEKIVRKFENRKAKWCKTSILFPKSR